MEADTGMARDAGMLATGILREVEQHIAEKVQEAHRTSKAEQVDSVEEAAGKEQKTKMRLR
jgi:phosphoribosylcarboxyaminoimidazole (NCAIR) mutase